MIKFIDGICTYSSDAADAPLHVSKQLPIHHHQQLWQAPVQSLVTAVLAVDNYYISLLTVSVKCQTPPKRSSMFPVNDVTYTNPVKTDCTNLKALVPRVAHCHLLTFNFHPTPVPPTATSNTIAFCTLAGSKSTTHHCSTARCKVPIQQAITAQLQQLLRCPLWDSACSTVLPQPNWTMLRPWKLS